MKTDNREGSVHRSFVAFDTAVIFRWGIQIPEYR